MQRTYELYAQGKDGRGRFKIVTCHEGEILHRAQDMLDGEDVKEVEVREGGRPLFTLTK